MQLVEIREWCKKSFRNNRQLVVVEPQDGDRRQVCEGRGLQSGAAVAGQDVPVQVQFGQLGVSFEDAAVKPSELVAVQPQNLEVGQLFEHGAGEFRELVVAQVKLDQLDHIC